MIADKEKLGRQLLEASKKYDGMRREIVVTMGLISTLLEKEDLTRHPSGVIREFTTPGLKWYIKRELKWYIRTSEDALCISAVTADDPEVIRGHAVYNFMSYVPPVESIWPDIKYIALIHRALPTVLGNLAEVFPVLVERYAPLLEPHAK